MTKLMAFVGATIVGSVVAARPAAAQVAGGTHRFIDVAVGGAYGDSPMPGIVPSMGIAFGVMSERHGLQFEFDVSGSHEENSGPYRYQYPFPSSQYLKQGHSYEDSTLTKTRSLSATALYARRIHAGGRMRAAFLLGGGTVSTPSQRTFVTKEVLPDGSRVVVDSSQFAFAERHLVAVVGIDADVRMSRHLSIVPSVRLFVFPFDMVADIVDNSGSGQYFLIGPQVSLRWRF